MMVLVLTNGKANAEGNVSDGIHPSIDSTAKKFMNTFGSMITMWYDYNDDDLSIDRACCKLINEKLVGL